MGSIISPYDYCRTPAKYHANCDPLDMPCRKYPTVMYYFMFYLIHQFRLGSDIPPNTLLVQEDKLVSFLKYFVKINSS